MSETSDYVFPPDLDYPITLANWHAAEGVYTPVSGDLKNMSDEKKLALEIQPKVEENPLGSFEITPIMIMKMDTFQLSMLEEVMRRLVNANPNYEFMVEDNVMSGGIRIKWRHRNEPGTNASSNS